MKKSRAIELLGGTVTTAAEAIGVTPSAVSQWPDDLPARLADRVLAAVARKHLPPELIGEASTTVSDPADAYKPEQHTTVLTATEPAPSEAPAAANGDEGQPHTPLSMGVELRESREDTPEADASYRHWREKHGDRRRPDRAPRPPQTRPGAAREAGPGRDICARGERPNAAPNRRY